MNIHQYSEMVERGEITCPQAIAAILNDKDTSPKVKTALTRTMSKFGAEIGVTFDPTSEETMRDSLEWIFGAVEDNPEGARAFIKKIENVDAGYAMK